MRKEYKIMEFVPVQAGNEYGAEDYGYSGGRIMGKLSWVDGYQILDNVSVTGNTFLIAYVEDKSVAGRFSYYSMDFVAPDETVTNLCEKIPNSNFDSHGDVRLYGAAATNAKNLFIKYLNQKCSLVLRVE